MESKVAAETEMITKKAMKKILNMRTGIASKFNRFYMKSMESGLMAS